MFSILVKYLTLTKLGIIAEIKGYKATGIIYQKMNISLYIYDYISIQNKTIKAIQLG